MERKAIRLLQADEIECRVSAVNEKGLGLLLYKDARVDQRILDETFGPFGWKRSHQSIEGNLYCTVEILDPKSGEWIAKQDVGAAGYTEKEKSQASDSFKRACFNWGIGRELYSAPFIWVPAAKVKLQKKGDKYYCQEHFILTDIAYSHTREITALAIAKKDGQEVFRWRKEGLQEPGQNGQLQEQEQDPDGEALELTKKQMDSLKSELQRTGVGMRAVQERYRIENPEKMGAELYGKVMRALAKTKSSEAA